MSSKPLRMTDDQYSEARRLTALVMELGIFRNCLNCSFWRDPELGDINLGCGKFQQLPPPKIIVHGCGDHSDNIPF